MEVRLKGSSSRNGTGHVEVFYRGQWGTICDYSWDINDANVVCRQLGYKNAFRAFQDNDGYSITQIWRGRLYCRGNEPNLTSCFHYRWINSNYCPYNAGVQCSSSGKRITLRFLSSDIQL